MVDFKDRLKAIRLECNESQVMTATRLNIARQTYLDLESGKTLPRLDIIEKIADLFMCCPCWLAFGYDINQPKTIRINGATYKKLG